MAIADELDLLRRERLRKIFRIEHQIIVSERLVLEKFHRAELSMQWTADAHGRRVKIAHSRFERRIKGLIFGASTDICRDQRGQEVLEFLFAGQVHR